MGKSPGRCLSVLLQTYYTWVISYVSLLDIAGDAICHYCPVTKANPHTASCRALCCLS